MTFLAKCFAVTKWMPYVVLLVVGFSAHSNIKVSVSDLLMFLSGLFWEGVGPTVQTLRQGKR